MGMLNKIRIITVALVMGLLLSGRVSVATVSARSSNTLSFVILSDYSRSLDIGDCFYLSAIASNGDIPTFKSSSSSIASVNTYGLVTAKKAGTATITAKVSGGEASCRIRVNKTRITVASRTITLENGASAKIRARTSNGSEITYRSNKSSVVYVEDDGTLLALKPGEALISLKADGSSETCKVIVKEPEVSLNYTSISLYRGQSVSLQAQVSSGIKPTWKSNRSSVAIVDENGQVTAIKNGTAIITAKVDGISKTCMVTVLKPVISLSDTHLAIKCGKSATLKANVSSGNTPQWSSSNSSVLSVDSSGKIRTYKKGTAYVTVSEDGTKQKCKVTVTA